MVPDPAMNNLRRTITSPAILSPAMLAGKSLRREADEALAAEGAVLLRQQKEMKRNQKQAKKAARRENNTELLAYAAFSHQDGWVESEEGGVFLAVDGEGRFLAPSRKDHTWYVPFSPTNPLHLLAWVRSARTGKVVSVET